MNQLMVWMVAGGLLVALELLTGTFYLLMIAIGAAAGALCAFMGASLSTQYVVASAVAGVAAFALRKTKYGSFEKRGAAQRDRNVNLDIGERLRVESWSAQGTAHVSRCSYRGAQWDVELLEGQPVAGMFEIREIQGSRLLVKPVA